ncbi:S8 family serine peptidase [Dyadobacter fermentans]|uniref:S8 family serine peptidase n=1 Tax=Dyadobacter fermentans TaxID=94254 RepID=UPI001CBB1B6B|nr:S8 family serine peptidase [Dyadobacter fermentans]MBZ1359969.1 S8 family peptidase [Dyadobacter fermentans]
MKKFLLLCLLVNCFNVLAQDEQRVLNGQEYPIWYSRTKVLVKFKDPARALSITSESLPDQVTKTVAIPSVSGMAFLELASNLSKDAVDRMVAQLRQHPDVLLAHPLLLNREGEESAGFTDLVIAKPKDGISEATLVAVFQANNLEERPNRAAPDANIYLTGPSILTDPLAVCEILNHTGLFEYTQPNCLRFVETAGTPNDPLYAANWGLAKMNLPAAWDMTTGCASIKIAIIDDGVQLNHPDLVGNLLPGFDATNSGTNGGHVAGEEMHGTYCAGFAAAKGNNGIGLAGVAYNSKLIPIRSFSTSLAGDITLDQCIVSAINHAVSVKGADVLSMSWGIVASSFPTDAAITNALNTAATNGRSGKGTVLVASTGNKGQPTFRPLPGNVASVLMIGASLSNDTRWQGSNYAAKQVDVVAPGPLVTTIAGSGYVNQTAENATSWSAATISGLAALVLSINPNLTETQVRRIIAETAEKAGGYSYVVGNGDTFSDLPHNNEMGYGRVNALKALEKAAGAPITGPALICNNGGYTLTTFPAGSSAVWSASVGLSMNGNLATRQNGYSGAGMITATLTVPNACAPIPVKRTIWVGSPNLTKTVNGVISGTTSVTAGGSYNLAASSSSPGTTFNYNNYAGSGNMTIDLYTPNSPATQMYVYSNSTNGFRQVKLTATNACGNYAEDFVFLLESGNFKAYPNPAKEKITLEFGNPAMLAVMSTKVELYPEKSAKPVHSMLIKDLFDDKGFREGNKLDLDVSKLPRGTYYLHVRRQDHSKEIVEKLRFILE